MATKRRRPKYREPKLRGLADARHRAMWTQRELSKKSGVPQGTISQLEGLNRGAQVTTIRKLAKALGVDPWSLVEPERRRE